ncbi:unnamed protein product [Spodoptera exigua]|nr:unnamed protein product [Spodoptera exigua]
MFGGSGGVGGGYSGGGGDCADGYGLGYVAGGGRLQQYAAHFAPHQNVWHHHHPTHHDTYGQYTTALPLLPVAAVYWVLNYGFGLITELVGRILATWVVQRRGSLVLF